MVNNNKLDLITSLADGITELASQMQDVDLSLQLAHSAACIRGHVVSLRAPESNRWTVTARYKVDHSFWREFTFAVVLDSEDPSDELDFESAYDHAEHFLRCRGYNIDPNDILIVRKQRAL